MAEDPKIETKQSGGSKNELEFAVNAKSGRVVRYFSVFLFFVLFVFIVVQLFFEKEARELFGIVPGNVDMEDGSLDVLRITYPSDPVSLQPTALAPEVRQRLSNVYEGLVKNDANLHVQPSLALSWGLIDELTWEFNLRKDVYFHDGSGFDAYDVIASINRARNYELSELKDILSTIDEVFVVDDYTLRISTLAPDPLLLQKLSTLYIIPAEYEEKEMMTPIGTGSYKFEYWDQGDDMVFSRFPDYWGKKAKFFRVETYTRVDKSERIEMLLSGKTDLLTFVPADAVSTVSDSGFFAVSVPTHEVQFLLFDMNSKWLGDVNVRRAVSAAFEKEKLVELLGGVARVSDQYVSNGIFGYNPSIEGIDYDLEAAKSVFESSDLADKTLLFNLPVGLDVLGEFVKDSLGDAGVKVIVSYLDPLDFLAGLSAGNADIYFLGFRSELGDAGDFFETIVHSNGEYNIGGYSNKNVDYLVDESKIEMNEHVRMDTLQKAMKIIVDEDIVGVPLFEYEQVMAFNGKIIFEPRVDGLIYFDEINVR